MSHAATETAESTYPDMRLLILALLTIAGAAHTIGQMPSPALPQVYVDTEWNPPSGGKIWRAHTAAEFQQALDSSSPGDNIVLDANATYRGSFSVSPKANPNHKWTYVQSSGLADLPAPGRRINTSADVVKMPKIVATGLAPAISILAGTSYYRFVGLEIFSQSTAGCDLQHTPRVNCFTYYLFDMPAVQGKPLPDSITVDRCYIHGSDTQDVRAGVVANGSNVAVIDSYISDIHHSVADSQAIRAYWTPGPIKVVNNFLSATTENLMFGGAGGADNPYIPSDIEIRHNHFYKPEKWAVPGVGLPPAAQWSVKNSLEFKNARRVLVTGNVFENNWASAQSGYSVVLTVRTSDSGNVAVVDDVTIENNVLKNVASGFNSLGRDDNCRRAFAPFCNNPGEAKRWKIANNLVLLRSVGARGALRTVAFQFLPEVADVVLEHNTVLASTGEDCWASIYFSVPNGSKWPLAQSDTRNIWISDNVLCRPPTGDFGGQGTSGLMNYMGDPAPVERRFSGNVILAIKDGRSVTFPSGNLVTTGPIHFAEPKTGNYQLITPKWVRTTDGRPAGVDAQELAIAVSGVTDASVSSY